MSENQILYLLSFLLYHKSFYISRKIFKKGDEKMKFKECPGYNKNTEIEKREIGSAGGEILYREIEVVLSESCSAFNKIDNFDCDECPYYKSVMEEIKRDEEK